MSDTHDDARAVDAYRVKDFVGVMEAARLIGVTKTAIYRWVQSGRLVGRPSGSGHLRFRRSKVLQFAEEYKRSRAGLTDGELQKAVFRMFADAEARAAANQTPIQTQMIHRDVVMALAVPIAVVRELWAEFSTALGTPVLVPRTVTVTVTPPPDRKAARQKADEDHDRELAALDAARAARDAEEEAAHQAHLSVIRGGR